MHLTEAIKHLRVSRRTGVALGTPATAEVTAALGVCDHPIPGFTADQTLIHLKETHVLVRCCAVVIDALFQSSTEGEGRVTKTVKGAWRVLTPPILTVRGVLALIDIRLLLRGHTAVAVSGQSPGQGADAVV